MAEQHIVAISCPGSGLIRFVMGRGGPDAILATAQQYSPYLLEVVGVAGGNWRTMQKLEKWICSGKERAHGDWWRMTEDEAREVLRTTSWSAEIVAATRGNPEKVRALSDDVVNDMSLQADVQMIHNMRRIGKPCKIEVTPRHRELAAELGLEIE